MEVQIVTWNISRMIFGLVRHAVKKKLWEECANALMLITILNTVRAKIGAKSFKLVKVTISYLVILKCFFLQWNKSKLDLQSIFYLVILKCLFPIIIYKFIYKEWVRDMIWFVTGNWTCPSLNINSITRVPSQLAPQSPYAQ